MYTLMNKHKYNVNKKIYIHQHSAIFDPWYNGKKTKIFGTLKNVKIRLCQLTLIYVVP